jgi:hypothetical protein
VSSDNPMLNAFWRVAPSVRLNDRAIRAAGVFSRASLFRARTSSDDHARRFVLFAICLPFALNYAHSLIMSVRDALRLCAIRSLPVARRPIARKWNARVEVWPKLLVEDSLPCAVCLHQLV